MSLLQLKNIVFTDDDSDYELPSLSERIKTFLKSPQVSNHSTSDSEDEDSEFLKFSEKIRSTPYSVVKLSKDGEFDNGSEGFRSIKSSEELQCSRLNIKLEFSASSDDESEKSEHINNLETIQSIPHCNLVKFHVEDSDSDGAFSDFVEKCRLVNTPKDFDKKFHVEDSDSDGAFSDFVEKFRLVNTPKDIDKKESSKVDDSSDDSFSNFVERFKTPMSVIRKNRHEEKSSDSDDSFSNSARKLRTFQTPRSQIKNRRDSVFNSPKMSENKRKYLSANSFNKQDSSSSLKVKLENEKEFDALFPEDDTNLNFLPKRKIWTRKLYEFFNRKVFNSQLPMDMPLIYDGALKTTAGLTCCVRKNDVYSCSIKLSSELLNSFDRLKNTLLHEMCHAAVWVLSKQRNVKHGPLWQIWASRCKLILPFVECPQRCHNYEISHRVWYHCPKCNWKTGRCKQVRKYHGSICKRCGTSIIVTYS